MINLGDARVKAHEESERGRVEKGFNHDYERSRY